MKTGILKKRRDRVLCIDKEIRKYAIALHELQDERLVLMNAGIREEEEMCERKTLYPIVDQKSWNFYIKQLNAFWQAEELNLSKELRDYRRLDDKEKYILEACLSFLSTADIAMIEALNTCLYFTSQSVEEKMFFAMQSAIESVHAQAYAEMVRAIAPGDSERRRIFSMAENIQSAKDKSDWMTKYMRSDCSNATLIMVYICAEGIFFLSPFMIQFWFKTLKKLNGILYGNELISRDEMIHKSKGESRYNSLINNPLSCGKLPDSEARDIVSEAVDLEITFTKEILPSKIKDLDPQDIIRYIKILGDNILRNCGHSTIYNEDPTKIPPYVKNGSLDIKTNFYEGEVGQYSQSTRGLGKISSDPYGDDYVEGFH